MIYKVIKQEQETVTGDEFLKMQAHHPIKNIEFKHFLRSEFKFTPYKQIDDFFRGKMIRVY